MKRPLALIVEDDPGLRGVLTLLLEMDGWSVAEAEDGLEGLRVARRMAPSLVVTDLNMPTMSGIEMARALASTPGVGDTPVVAVTSDGSEMRSLAKQSGLFVEVLRKPVAPRTLLEVVRKAAKGRPPEGRPT